MPSIFCSEAMSIGGAPRPEKVLGAIIYQFFSAIKTHPTMSKTITECGASNWAVISHLIIKNVQTLPMEVAGVRTPAFTISIPEYGQVVPAHRHHRLV